MRNADILQSQKIGILYETGDCVFSSLMKMLSFGKNVANHMLLVFNFSYILSASRTPFAFLTILIRPFEKRSYYVIPLGVRPSVCPSVKFFVSV